MKDYQLNNVTVNEFKELGENREEKSLPPCKPGSENNHPHKPDKPGHENNKPGFPERMVTIYINGRPHEVKDGTELSFADIVVIAFGKYESNSTTLYTVSFSKGTHSNQQGVLVAGQVLKVKGGMIINVGRSSRS